MVWITFFLTLLSGAITALIGVHIQHWYSSRKTREKLLKALKNELELNERRLTENLLFLEKEKLKSGGHAVLISLFITRVYDVMLVEDPQTMLDLVSKTNGLIDVVYTEFRRFNATFNAMSFGFVKFTNFEGPIKELNELEKEIKKIRDILEEII